jgi:hypothetical protein
LTRRLQRVPWATGLDPGASSRTNGQELSTTMCFNLQEAQSCSEIPACRGPEVLAILVEIDPISGKESEEYPHFYPKDYPERVEKFCGRYIWRKIIGEITIEFIEAAVERMFSADEVTSVVDPAKLKRLKHQIVSLFLKL